jgi:hypothetical protein
MTLVDLGPPFDAINLTPRYREALEAAITALIERERADAVKAATEGMVPAPKPIDLTASTDQYGAVRCVMCGRPKTDHDDAECPRGAAERYFAIKTKVEQNGVRHA